MTETVIRNPVDVQKHWTRKLLPQPSQEHVDYISSQLALGTKLPPGYLVLPNLLVAGETRRLAHKARQMDMEFIVVTEEEAMNIALGENTGRQSYQYKYQIAFIYCPLAAKVVEWANKRKGQIQQNIAETPMNSRKAGSGFSGPQSLEEVADLIGVSRTLMVEAKKTYDALLEWDKTNKPKKWGDSKKVQTALDYWTDRIMYADKPCSVGQAFAGLAGSEAAAEGKTNPEPKQLELFCDGLKSLQKWGKAFPKFEGPQRKAAVDQIKKTVAAWPAELRHELGVEIKRLAVEEREGK